MPSAPSRDHRSPLNITGRVVAVVLLMAVFWFITFVLAEMSWIASSGCLLECVEATKNATAGGLWKLAAVTTSLVPVVLGYVILRRPELGPGDDSEPAWRRRRRNRRALGILFTLLAIPVALVPVALFGRLTVPESNGCCDFWRTPPTPLSVFVPGILLLAAPVCVTTFLNSRDRNPARPAKERRG